MAHARPIRSYLFVPANRPERITKAQQAGAGAVIVDLEDAVAPDDKASARAVLAGQLTMERQVLIRINGADTPWFGDDLKLCAAPGVAGVLVPKAEQPEVLAEVARVIGVGKTIIPIIETALGFDKSRALAASGHVQRLAFGSIDFQIDLRIDGEEEELLYFRSQLVLVSRLMGLAPPVDGVTVAIDDAERLSTETHRGRRLGFGAKLCIHPKQVPIVNACFTPTPEAVAWAQRVVDAAKCSNGSAVAVDGKMIDVPVIRKAQGILNDMG
ncbi:MAG: CoA ester lyase [bacterium]|nr:CoA ester lyase [bacterium]